MRDITLGETIYPRFTTRQFSDGVPTTLSGTPVLSIYEENNLTQITAGVSVTVDYDTVTGLNQATVVATSGNGYESGKSYDLVITTGTVGGTSVVGEVVFSFTVEASAAATDLANGTDGLGAIKAETALILADTGELQTDWANGGRLDLILDARMAEASINTTGGAVDTVTTVTNVHADSDLTTALTELAQAAPSATPDLRNAIMLLYMALRNKTVTQTSGTDALEIYNNAGTLICKKLLTDDGADYTEAEMVSGP